MSPNGKKISYLGHFGGGGAKRVKDGVSEKNLRKGGRKLCCKILKFGPQGKFLNYMYYVFFFLGSMLL